MLCAQVSRNEYARKQSKETLLDRKRKRNDTLLTVSALIRVQTMTNKRAQLPSHHTPATTTMAIAAAPMYLRKVDQQNELGSRLLVARLLPLRITEALV